MKGKRVSKSTYNSIHDGVGVKGNNGRIVPSSNCSNINGYDSSSTQNKTSSVQFRNIVRQSNGSNDNKRKQQI